MSLVSTARAEYVTEIVLHFSKKNLSLRYYITILRFPFLFFAGFIDFIGFMSYIPFFAKLIRTILDHPLTISELERARERVKQHDLTFKPKKKAKEPKSWEVF